MTYTIKSIAILSITLLALVGCGSKEIQDERSTFVPETDMQRASTDAPLTDQQRTQLIRWRSGNEALTSANAQNDLESLVGMTYVVFTSKGNTCQAVNGIGSEVGVNVLRSDHTCEARSHSIDKLMFKGWLEHELDTAVNTGIVTLGAKLDVQRHVQVTHTRSVKPRRNTRIKPCIDEKLLAAEYQRALAVMEAKSLKLCDFGVIRGMNVYNYRSEFSREARASGATVGANGEYNYRRGDEVHQNYYGMDLLATPDGELKGGGKVDVSTPDALRDDVSGIPAAGRPQKMPINRDVSSH